MESSPFLRYLDRPSLTLAYQSRLPAWSVAALTAAAEPTGIYPAGDRMKCLEPDCSSPEGQAAQAAGGKCRGFMYWVQRANHTDKYTLRAGVG